MSSHFHLRVLLTSLLACLATSSAMADPVWNGTTSRRDPMDLGVQRFDLELKDCGAAPTFTIEYETDSDGGPGGAAPPAVLPAITCAHLPEGGPLERYRCDVPPELRGKKTGQLKTNNPNCRPIVADVRSPASPQRQPKPAVAAGAHADEQDASQPSPPFLPEERWQMVLKELGLPVANHRPGNYYSRSSDAAVLFFDADGDGYYPMLDVIDEDDDIYVVVADYASRLSTVSVSIAGCNRPPSEPRVYGKMPEAAARGGVEEPIQFVIRPIGKCAGADSGGPQLTVKRGINQQVQTIPVNPLYRLAVGVAAAYDDTRQRNFVLNTLPGETVPRIAEVDDHIGLTALVFISFYPSARDFRKTDALLWQRTQLFVGLDPRAFDRHLVVGLGYELTQGLNALLGWRALTKQRVLVEGSGLRPGMTFDADVRDLPTRERWETGGIFLGVGLSNSLLAKLR